MITCWLHQRLLSLEFDSDKGPGEWTTAHLRGCPGCRRYHEGLIALAQGLRRQAALEPQPHSPYLQGRIMAALRRPAPVTNPVPAPLRLHRLILSGLGVAALLVMVLPRHEPGPIPSPPALQPSKSAAVTVGALLPARLELPHRDRLLELTGAWDAPLETELQLVMADATAAARQLARDFIPDALK
jgi:predicted anti-sigma-YlaC factor YlaD